MQSVRSDVSGKGINVSIVLKQLGWDTICLGYQYINDRILVQTLREQGIQHDLIPVPGDLRINVKVFDTAKRVMTEFNEPGGRVGQEHVHAILEQVVGYIEQAEMVVINGSVPAGVPEDLYYRIIEMVNTKGKLAILDASGPLLLNGIKAKPYLIKPNKHELESAFQCTIHSIEDAIDLSRKVIAEGVAYVCVSMGKDGALLVNRDRAYYSSGADIEVKGVQGSGDSLVAGICIALLQKKAPEDILRYGVAVAHGSLLHEGTQLCQPEDLEQMLQRITVVEIDRERSTKCHL